MAAAKAERQDRWARVRPRLSSVLSGFELPIPGTLPHLPLDRAHARRHAGLVSAADSKGAAIAPCRGSRSHRPQVWPSPAAHQELWAALGHQDQAPIAYVVDNQIHMDMSRWPQDLPLEWDPSGITPRK
jgi:hypothetical protein